MNIITTTTTIKLNKKELSHLINDTLASIYRIKETVFGDIWNFGADITEVKKITPEQEERLKIYGYYSRKELFDKLKKIEKDNFKELNYCE